MAQHLPDDSIEDESLDTDISREFLAQYVQGQDPFCTRPWKVLKVTLANHTKVCCDFFTLLPEFKWPSAKDFHRPDQMWNHPFMQHMRKTMGTLDEVPYCTLCQTKDKRSLRYVDQRAETKRASLELFRRFEDEALADTYRGSINAWKGRLVEFVEQLGPGRQSRPFAKEEAFYRRAIRAHNFSERGRILLLGAPSPVFAPFLAEVNENLTIADSVVRRAERAANLCRAFHLEPKLAEVTGDAPYPFDDGAFDAVWIDGRMLHESDRQHLFGEVRRVLGPNGTLHVQAAPGPGELLRAALAADDDTFGSLLAALKAGPRRDASHNFFTGQDLRRILRRLGLRLEIALQITTVWLRAEQIDQIQRLDPAGEELRALAASYAVIADGSDTKRYERYLTFSARPDGPPEAARSGWRQPFVRQAATVIDAE
jgi:SAM-dependent methyltransferase